MISIRFFYYPIVSIHTPTQGVTDETSETDGEDKVSIHTPTQGVTNAPITYTILASFNPHTHAGCDG